MAKILEAKEIYDILKERLKTRLKSLPALTLASLSIGKNYSSQVYRASQKKLAESLGVKYLSLELPQDISIKAALAKIKSLNNNKKITGIVANKPFPSTFTEEIVFSAIDYKKDIEGMNPYNLGLLFIGEPLFISPTVLSILEFIKMSGIELYGRQVTIVGFSTLIGKPLALILGRKLATVTITHIGTYESGKLPFYIKNSDIVVSAVGKPHIIKGDWIKKGAVVIDVGIGQFNGKVVGDIEFEKAKRKAAFITPVPGGVGKLTSLFLFRNLIDAYKKYA
ncbi:MAG: bifunctional 5,10-methylenetetrahydrofolate dehydrogenase/5,10-methenyltetrahydrofolate cyclohydrolase [Candidatus Omnitrophota bacterium]